MIQSLKLVVRLGLAALSGFALGILILGDGPSPDPGPGFAGCGFAPDLDFALSVLLP
jgi:hypothetical protein